MTPASQGSIRLFRLWGITVFLHWSWFVVAVYSVSQRIPDYAEPVWGLLEYLALFLMVLMHEFGHSRACRMVGGRADEIVLWPLGGVAFVAPPQRPGAVLWSIAAGPLVNVVLLPVTVGLVYLSHQSGWVESWPNLHKFLRAVTIINGSLLLFNLLPVYPLDGGQILRALLWYPFGRSRSLMIATMIGFVGGAALVALAVYDRSLWMGFVALFLLSYCYRSFQEAKTLRKIEQLPRRAEFACPECHAAPPAGPYWRCPQCGNGFDVFVDGGVCAHCSTVQTIAPCPDCGAARPLRSWDKSIVDA